MPTLAEQLGPLLEQWADRVMQEATDLMVDAATAVCPEDEGVTRASIEGQMVGPSRSTITVDDRGFTDEGPAPHHIEGNPLLVFDWPEKGLFPAVFRHVDWVPGAGVEANKGWFTERAMSDDNFTAALQIAAQSVDL